MSPSSRNRKLRVTGSSAETSEATKFSCSPMPITTGQPMRATMMRSGSLLGQHRQRIGAFQFGHGGAHGLEQVAQRLQVEVDAMRDDLGVGLGGEHVARRAQFLAQLLVVLDDAVVHDGERHHARYADARCARDGTPCVAQRVCAMPVAPASGVPSSASCSIFTLPTVRRRADLAAHRSTTARPAES